ncbi:MAG: permease [Bacillota bacterium]|nr:permease [Bacillota bacterium]
MRSFLPMVLLLGVYVVLALTNPAACSKAAASALAYLGEVLAIMPGIALIMGLFEVWVPKALVQRLMGQGSGPKGVLLAVGLGTAPTGPLYVAFPIAASLGRKGASPSNLVIFLGTWAAVKVPQVMMEARFLGLRFALARLTLTLAALALLGPIAARLLAGWTPPAEAQAGGGAPPKRFPIDSRPNAKGE